MSTHTRFGASRLLAVFGVVATAMMRVVAPAQAEPAAGDPAPNPYPDLRYFAEIDSAPYNLGPLPSPDRPFGKFDPGVWFVTTQGLSCGIWYRGSFGCTGDVIPGASADVHQIGWVTGDARVHYDWTMAVRFPGSRGSLTIPPLNYITMEGTSCGTTFDGSTYCERGPFRMLITTTHTWLNG
ncbi:hypothetical protein [Mycolicibacterium hodleri]|uniref:Secreted protein n=1 Tax=Mycolicibacterium hodleri TaxID=49897 RepID=A0A502E8T9_9MYCO|nr:hypothetical protein [Mycolicibacterium hodleri]TPG32861.1 hypothetical protein EAH80_18995 [Mycolicibacterium hodleri]